MIFKYDKSKDYLIEMSMNKRSIELDIYRASDIIREHLMMIYLYNSMSNNHWVNEIYGALHHIPKCKSNNKFLSKNEILDGLLYSWEDSYDELLHLYIKDIECKENKLIEKDFDKNDLLEFIEDYCFWISDMLSKFGFVTSGEVKDEINSILYSRKM